MTVELILGSQQEKIIQILKEEAWLSTSNIIHRLFPEKSITESVRSSVYTSLRGLEAKGFVACRKIQKEAKNKYRTGKNRHKPRQKICIWIWKGNSS